MPVADARMERFLWLLLLWAAIGFGTSSAGDDQDLDNTIDPGGGWVSPIGELSLMHTGNTLAFSYSAVFGSTAHLCDGAGVAGLVGRDRYEWGDEEGTVSFQLNEETVTLELVNGVASFCGSGWVGDSFTREAGRSTEICVVEPKRSHFAVVEAFSPEQRQAYVIEGDTVEVAPVRRLC